MKALHANDFQREHEYNHYRKEEKKKDHNFRKERKDKKQRWSNSVEM